MTLRPDAECLAWLPPDEDDTPCAFEDHRGQSQPSFIPRVGTRSATQEVFAPPAPATPQWNNAEICQVLKEQHHILIERLEELMFAQEERQQKMLSNFMDRQQSGQSDCLQYPCQSQTESFQLQSHSESMVESEVIALQGSYAALSPLKKKPPQVNFCSSTTSDESINPKASLRKYHSMNDMRELTVPVQVCATYSILTTHHAIRNSILKMVQSPYFELFFACMISSNAVVLGVEVGLSSSQNVNSNVFYAIQVAYTAIFSVELILRVVGNGGCLKFLIFPDGRAWNLFDSFVLIFSLAETVINLILVGKSNKTDSVTRWVRIARVARLIRVLRILRIVRFIGPLRVLVVSIVSTMKSLFWAVTLLIIIIYMFAVILAQASADHLNEVSADMLLQSDMRRLDQYWGSLLGAMYTLFMSISGGISWHEVIAPLDQLGRIWAAVFTVFVVFTLFAVLNVMTGVFCESAISSAQKSYDVKWQVMMSDREKHIANLKSIFDQIDATGSGELELDALDKYWQEDSMQSFFADLDLEPNDCWMFFTVLANHCEGGVKLEEFVDGCMRLKGAAKAFDVAVVSLELRHLSSQLFEFMNDVEDKLSKLSHMFRDESQSRPLKRKSRRGKTVTLLKSTS